jgi:hypothetical protein
MRYILFILLISCATVQPPFDTEAFKNGLYRKEVVLSVDGKTGLGALTVPKKEKYDIWLSSLGNMDLFRITTCHRETILKGVGFKGNFLGIGKNDKLTNIKYSPVKDIEDNGTCPVEFGFYEKKKGRHSWGVLIIESNNLLLPSTTKCNGETLENSGVSVCQSRAGLIQRIVFSEAVVFQIPKNGCKYDFKITDNKVFEYRMPEGECMVYFQEINDNGRIAEHYDYGYKKILVD